jgi:hydrogenase expression/formation protein HypC
MCLAIPARISALLDNDMAKAEVAGVVKDVNLALVDGVGVGDYVIIHVGFALSRLEPEEAEQTLALFAEAGMLDIAADAGERPQ